jgi:hypothetical protein
MLIGRDPVAYFITGYAIQVPPLAATGWLDAAGNIPARLKLRI